MERLNYRKWSCERHCTLFQVTTTHLQFKESLEFARILNKSTNGTNLDMSNLAILHPTSVKRSDVSKKCDQFSTRSLIYHTAPPWVDEYLCCDG